MRQLIVIIFSLICFSGFSQTTYPVATIPSPRGDSAFAQYGYIRSLTLGIDAVGDTMIRPRLAGSSRTWIHGGNTEVWKWDGTKWVLTGTSSAGGGTITDFSSGNLSPLFTTSVATSTSTPALSFSLSAATAWRVFSSNVSTTPAYNQLKAEHLNTTYSNGNMLITDGSGNLSWTTAGSTGTVTSVAATAASGMTVTGSPVTTSGTLAFAWTGAVQGDLPYFSGTNTISFLNKSTTASRFLKNSGTNNNPAWAAIGASDLSFVYQVITATAGQTAFAFTAVPTTANAYNVYINGSVCPKSYYSVGGNTITFSAGLTLNDVIMIQGVQ